ncbi:cytochrome P450 [Streptomyces sp. NPDC001292]|uniref:cytochrome P450 n=1 Tax=Streptomyces sp. NPDC001292 TaxID=3364558 RepID=UPI00367C2E52
MTNTIDQGLYDACPYPYYEQLRSEPVREQPGIGYVVSRHEDVLMVLRNPDTFSAAFNPGFGSSRLTLNERPPSVDKIMAEGYPECPALAHTDGETHKRHRGFVNRAFTPRQVAKVEPMIRSVANDLIDHFIDRGRAEMLSEFSGPLPLTMISDALGLPREDLSLFKEWTEALQGIRARVVPEAEFIGRAHKWVAFQRYFGAVVEDRLANPRDDLASAILRAGNAGETPLESGELMNIFVQLILGGNETAASTFNSGMLTLARDAGVQERLRNDPALIPDFVEEVLRRDSPVLGIPRIATRDTRIGEVDIPAGSRLLVLFGSANRDDSVFPHSDDFELERENVRSHLAFGIGIHFCVGAPLARAELRIGFEQLLSRLGPFSLAPGFEPNYIGGPLGHRLERLDLQFTPGGH